MAPSVFGPSPVPVNKGTNCNVEICALGHYTAFVATSGHYWIQMSSMEVLGFNSLGWYFGVSNFYSSSLELDLLVTRYCRSWHLMKSHL